LSDSSGRLRYWFPPLVWATFVWLYLVVALTNLAPFYFYLLVRGIGVVPYLSGITVASPRADMYLLIGASLFLLATHLAIDGKEVVHDGLGALGSASLVFGLVGYYYSQEVITLLLGMAGLALAVTDAERLGKAHGVNPRTTSLRLAFALALVLLAVSALSLSRWLLDGVDGVMPFSNQSWGVALAALRTSSSLYKYLPEVALLFLFAWAVRLAISSGLGAWKGGSQGEVPGPGEKPREWLSRRGMFAILGLALALAIIVGVYPYLPAINPTSRLVGVDVKMCYYNWLNSLPYTNHVCGPLSYTLGNEHIGALWFLQGLSYLVGSATLALKAAPAIFGVFLVASTFFLVWEGTRDRLLASMAALLAGISTQVIVGMNAGVLANWLGLAVANLFFALVLRGTRTQKPLLVVPGLAAFAALLFIHPWTWAFAFAALVVYLSIIMLQSWREHEIRSRRFEASFLTAIVALGVASDAVKSFLPTGSAFETAFQAITSVARLSNVPMVASNLEGTFQTFLGGAVADPLWYLLGIVGVLSVPALRGRFQILMTSWLAVSSVGIVLVSDRLFQGRFINLIPIQIFAAMGMVVVIRFVGTRLDDGTEAGSKLAGLTSAVFTAATVGLLLAYTLSYVGFLY
jgi:hypothetical protein